MAQPVSNRDKKVHSKDVIKRKLSDQLGTEAVRRGRIHVLRLGSVTGEWLCHLFS